MYSSLFYLFSALSLLGLSLAQGMTALASIERINATAPSTTEIAESVPWPPFEGEEAFNDATSVRKARRAQVAPTAVDLSTSSLKCMYECQRKGMVSSPDERPASFQYGINGLMP